METVKRIKMKPYQSGFMRSKARFPNMTSAWGTGKSMFVCCLKPVEQCLKQPGNQWLIVRKEFTRLEDSTIPDFEKYTALKVGSDKNVKIRNEGWPKDAPDSVVMFRHGDQINQVEVLQNMNLGGFSIEQAEEFETDREFQMLRGRLRGGEDTYGCISANTKGHNWIWKLWKKKDLPVLTDELLKSSMQDSGLTEQQTRDAFDPNHYELFEATTFDNKSNLPLSFVQDLARQKVEAPHNYNRFVMNSWEDLDIADKVIPYSAIQKAIGWYYVPLRTKTLVSLDPAEMGDDETVIYGIESGKIIKRKIYCKKEPMETAGYAFAMMREISAQAVVIDPIGIGSGIRSRLVELGCPVISADSRYKAGDSETYFNLRAEIWFAARQRFIDQTVSLPDDDDKLVEELGAVGYEMLSKGLRKIHPKEKIKKADYLGHSPSRAECLVQALWAEESLDYDKDKIIGLEDYVVDDKTDMAESYNIPSVL